MSLRDLVLFAMMLGCATSQDWLLKKCGPESVVSKYASVPVCLMTNVGRKSVFYPKVDEYSVLDVKDINSQTYKGLISTAKEAPSTNATNIDSLQIAVRLGNVVSYPKAFNRAGYIVPFWTAIVHMTNGVVDNIFWDDGCFTCSPDSAECMRDGAAADRYFGDADKAVDLTTYSQGEDCAVSEEGQASACSEAGECDARVYLAWLGTDSQGEPLTSAGSVISRFRSFSLKGMMDQTKKNINKLTYG